MTTPDVPDNDELTPLIEKILRIKEVTWGDASHKFYVRYRGELRGDSMEAYDAISEALKKHTITPFFRDEENQHTILLIKGLIEPQPSNPWINLILFLVTLVSVLMAGADYNYQYIYDKAPGETLFEAYKVIIANLGLGWPFAASLLGILLAHEFGHYLTARYHRTAVTLPYFIPLPFLGGLGTLGAAIQLKEPPKNKRVLMDIGVAGPLAGLVIAIPVLLYGLSLSALDNLPDLNSLNQSSVLEGNSILYLAAKYLVHGKLLPLPVSYGDISPFVYWTRYLLTGLPIPYGAEDVFMHPIALAGWVGLLVTAINLIPTGQLDGGHTLFSLIGDRVKKLRPYVITIMVFMGLLYTGWWIWALLIFFLGRNHAEPYDQITPLNPLRKILAVFTLIIFVLVFTPVPLRMISVAGGGF